MSERAAGVLLPISALPSRYGIGCFCAQAYAFVDFLAAAGQRYWQILPLSPTGVGDSPYQSVSGFAGSPYMIDLDELVQRGYLHAQECARVLPTDYDGEVDYALQYRARMPLLRLAYARFCKQADTAARRAFADFCSREAHWLDDYALFMAIKDEMGGAPFFHWPTALRDREESALRESRVRLGETVEYYGFLQFLFFEQWRRLHRYARDCGVRIIGDLPIYVAADSVDVWTQPALFQLDAECRPTAVAGCPSDGFSKGGQLWGNPLYRWSSHKAQGFAFWIARLRHFLSMYDVVRIDHFRGFASYYSIPYGAKDARGGHWERGEGKALFAHLSAALGECPLIAEDLGHMSDDVRELLAFCGFPGMKVLQFAFDRRDEGNKNDHLPHRYPENCVAYPGTHDNQTLRGWLEGIGKEERAAVRSYLCDFHTPISQLSRPLLALLLRSRARLCIVPLQDYLGLDDAARINTPSTTNGNWTWRVRQEQMTPQLAKEIRRMCAAFGR